MALLNKQQILKNNYKHKDVYIKELDGEVRIRELAIDDQLKFEEEFTGQDSSKVIYGLIMSCCIDEEGNKIFDEQDLKALKQQSANIIIHLFKEILALNAMTEAEIDKLAKN